MCVCEVQVSDLKSYLGATSLKFMSFKICDFDHLGAVSARCRSVRYDLDT